MAQAAPEASAVDTYRLLVEQVIAGQGLAGVIRLLADTLGLPATVANEDLEPLHSFAPRGKQLSADEAGLPPEVRSAVSFDLAGEPQASTDPPTVSVQSLDGREYTVAPVVLPTGVLAYIWVEDPSSHISPRARGVVSNAAAACALEMVRQRAMMEGESRVRSSFLEDLLTGMISSVNSTRRRAHFLGYELRGNQVVFALDLDNFSRYIEKHRLDEGGIQQLKERFRRSVNASIPAVWNRTLIWEHSDSMVVLAPVGKQSTPAALRDRVEVLRCKVESKLKGPSISAGIGRSYADLSKLQHSYREAEHALSIGATVSGPSSTSAFEDLGAYRLLYHLRDHPELDAFCDESIGALERYDKEHGTTLVETLGAFLELQGNLSQTARVLHLHRNGLVYRLSRIESIADCDLGNASQRLSLQLAFLARPLVRRKHRSRSQRADSGGEGRP